MSSKEFDILWKNHSLKMVDIKDIRIFEVSSRHGQFLENMTPPGSEHDFMSSVPAIRSDNTERSATFSILNLYESILNVL